MGVGRNLFRGGQRQRFAYTFQVADDTMQIDVYKTLYPSTTQRKCPVLRHESQKCASLAAIARHIMITQQAICTFPKPGTSQSSFAMVF